ncbi:uncharacterized protein [Epargyreus clarus]|uniref:uncharacterized protein n=1 Tax=Epargyreus clarus TaxID=520877 RepID=UPI003C2C10E3
MSLLKLIKAPVKLFKKDVITFLIIRRHDLGVIENKLRYISVKPTASVSVLRQKVWHLLDLPDYCEEVIILKAGDDSEIPLTHLRKGNDPQHPYFLEVWMPGKHKTLHNNMLTMGNGDAKGPNTEDLSAASSIFEEKIQFDLTEKHYNTSKPQTINDAIGLNKHRILRNHSNNIIPSDCKQSDISCKISTSSLFYRLHGRKSRDNFANILMKIQSDLNNLSNKLSNLENKIQL